MRVTNTLRKGHRLARRLITSYPRFAPVEQLQPDILKENRAPAHEVNTPASLHMTFRKDAAHYRKETYTVPEDYTTTLEGALICLRHNVVLTRNGDVVEESSNAGTPRFFPRTILDRRREVGIPGYSVVLRARFHNYYHFLIDELPRMLALAQPPYTELEEIQLLYSGRLDEVERFLLNKLGLTNVCAVSLDESPIYRTEHLIFTPFKTRLQAGYLPQRYV